MKSLIHSPWLYIAILAIGLFFKVYRIDQKFFWFDEVATIGHTSGNQIKEPPIDEILSIRDYKEQLRLNHQGYRLGSQLKGLFTSTNLNPLHYPFLMIWIRMFGDEPVTYRWFNVFVFLLTLPVLFLLARKLFVNPLAGWVAVTIFACSPYINFFTHEARYHITWAFFIISACYLFIKSIEKNKWNWWSGYVVTAVCSLYISLISAPVLLGLFIWGFIYHKKSRWNVLIVSAISAMIYLPWVYWLYQNRGQIDNSLAWHSMVGKNVSPFKLLFMQFFVPARSFGVPGDFISFRFPRPNFDYAELMTLYPFLLILASILFSAVNKKNKAGRFLLFVFLPIVIFLILSDMIRGVGGSQIHRYQVINVIGAILLVSYLLSHYMDKGKLPAFAAYLLLISMGIFTMQNASKNPIWDMPGAHKLGRIIREGKFYSSKEAPLLISDFKNMPMNLGYLKFLEIANSFETDQLDILYASPGIEKIDSLILSKDYSDIYISYSSDGLVDHLKSGLGERVSKLELEGVSPIWKIDIAGLKPE